VGHLSQLHVTDLLTSKKHETRALGQRFTDLGIDLSGLIMSGVKEMRDLLAPQQIGDARHKPQISETI
jgi:hypothetical protein